MGLWFTNQTVDNIETLKATSLSYDLSISVTNKHYVTTCCSLPGRVVWFVLENVLTKFY
jgi:hypothetical protein